MSQKKCTCQITSQVALPVHLCSSGEDLQPFSRAPHLVFNYSHSITEHTTPYQVSPSSILQPWLANLLLAPRDSFCRGGG